MTTGVFVAGEIILRLGNTSPMVIDGGPVIIFEFCLSSAFLGGGGGEGGGGLILVLPCTAK